MNLDDFKSDWQQADLPGPRFDEIAAAVKTRTQEFESQIFWRDVREIAAAAFVAIVFAPLLYRTNNWTTRAGAVIAILTAIEICIILQWARRKDRPAGTDLPLLAYCQAELARVDRQIRLLESVAWWYIAPMLIGANLIFTGIGISVYAEISKELPTIDLGWPVRLLHIFWVCNLTYGIATLVLGRFLFRLNRRAVKDSLHPLRESLAGLLKECDNDPI